MPDIEPPAVPCEKCGEYKSDCACEPEPTPETANQLGVQVINELLRKPHLSDYQVIVMAAANLPGTDWAHNVNVATKMLAMSAAAVAAGKFHKLYTEELKNYGMDIPKEGVTN